MSPILPQILVALVAAGMALAFVAADRKSPTSRALGLALGCVAAAIVLNSAYYLKVGGFRGSPGWLAIPEALANIYVLEWVARVRRTLPENEKDTRFGDRILRFGQLAAVLYVALALAYPETRARDFLYAASNPDVLWRPGFWLFAAPIVFSALTGFVSGALLLNRRPDRPERIRMLALAAATPFLVCGFVLRPDVSAISVMIGEIIFLIGSLQYHVLQGQRGQFMSRFLSTQVAELVRERGLRGAMEQNYLEITVVVSDLRGFTAYAQAHPSSRVIEVLSDYYDAVGRVVSDYGATIKDFAGDGILILVGAPIPKANHADVGLALAQRVRDVAREVTARWSDVKHPLGIGLGVASGFVTVGVIGSASRLEYVAVGPAVNLASRLCEQAADGDILVDARARELAGDEELEERRPISVKGFDQRIALYAVS